MVEHAKDAVNDVGDKAQEASWIRALFTTRLLAWGLVYRQSASVASSSWHDTSFVLAHDSLPPWPPHYGTTHRPSCHTRMQAAAVAKSTGGAVVDVTKQAVGQVAEKASRALETEEQRMRWVGCWRCSASCRPWRYPSWPGVCSRGSMLPLPGQEGSAAGAPVPAD